MFKTLAAALLAGLVLQRAWAMVRERTLVKLNRHKLAHHMREETFVLLCLGAIMLFAIGLVVGILLAS